MSASTPSSDRVGEALIARLLQDALKDLALAFGRANKTATLFTLAAIERDLVARAEAYPGLLATPQVSPDTINRVIARVSALLAEVQRAVEDLSIQ
jgi:hypothetical protein